MHARYIHAIPDLTYGHGNEASMTEDEVRQEVNITNPPYWNQCYLGAENLAAFLRFARLGWNFYNAPTRTILPLLYKEQHAASLAHARIGGLPWGQMLERQCHRRAVSHCHRCNNRTGGFAFGWIGPWSCTRSLADNIHPDRMRNL